jgi:prephenate dehydrogenase
MRDEITVAIVGVGLIGGSVGKAVRAAGFAARIIGIGRREAALKQAYQLGAISEYTTDLEAGVEAANVIIIGTPVEGFGAFLAGQHPPPPTKGRGPYGAPIDPSSGAEPAETRTRAR